MAPSIGLIFGSRQRMACRFVPNAPYPPEAYVGVMNTIGLDVSITAGGIMAWGVFAEISGVCGKTVPGQGRIAACLIANKSTASKDCVDAIQKVEALAAK
jgi:hypothetical protein